MRTAVSRVTDAGGTLHYLSLFDGENGSINSVAKSFNLKGLPPVDLKGKCQIHFVESNPPCCRGTNNTYVSIEAGHIIFLLSFVA